MRVAAVRGCFRGMDPMSRIERREEKRGKPICVFSDNARWGSNRMR